MRDDEIKLPHWDMSTLYPGLDSARFEQGFQSTIQAIGELTALFDQHNVAAQESPTVNGDVVTAFEQIIGRYDAVHSEAHTMHVYIESYVDTDSRYELAQTKLGEFRSYMSQLSLLRSRLDAWVASFDSESLLEQSAVARNHAFMIHKAQQRAARQMPAAEEVLASEMSQFGSVAWTSLWSTLTSQLAVDVEVDGEVQGMTMSDVRNLAYDPDRATRHRAYEAELAAWDRAAVPLAAALNCIKGEQVLLAKRRGWDSPLEAALFTNNIDRQTLDALMEALQEAFPHFRRYLRAKARLLGLPALAWYDLNAPVGGGGQSWSYGTAKQFIVEQFNTYSPRMSDLAQRAFQERWVDAEPRGGKLDVSYCKHLQDDESRILVNFKPTFFEVTMLAHELGHAYHNLNLSRRTALQRETPMTLAETASTFCQTIVQIGGLEQATFQEQITALDASLQFTTLMALETTTWFMFEKAVCEKRESGELSLEKLKQLMLNTQRQIYGDGLDPDKLHPFTWVAWPHQYLFSFYNFQYSFGTLFGLGLYRRYQDDPETFKARYDDLLSSTGMGGAAELAARFDIDIRSVDSWRASLGLVRADIDRFEAAVDQYLGTS